MNSQSPWAYTPEWLTDELKTALSNAGLSLDKDGMLLLWQNVEAQAKTYKALEMEYRKVCVGFLVPDPIEHEGMNTIPLGAGFEAKAGIKYNYNLKDIDTVEAGLSKLAALGNSGPFIAERLVKWEVSFLLTEYRVLQEAAKSGSAFAKDAIKIISEFMVVEEASPTLLIKEPKVKGKK
jgi:hypothetical protein